MSEAAAIDEFPFVSNLPKREKSKVRKALDLVEELSRITDEQGPLVPAPLAARVLGVSRQRLHVLIQDGRLPVVRIQDHIFLTKQAVIDFANTERKSGRPVTPPTRFVDQVKLAWSYGHGK